MTYYQELQSVYLAPSRVNLADLICLFNLAYYKANVPHLPLSSHRYRLSALRIDSLINSHALLLFIVKFCKRAIYTSITKKTYKPQRRLNPKKWVEIRLTC